MTESDDLMTLLEAIEVGESHQVELPRPVLEYLNIQPGHPVKVEKGLGDYVVVKPRDDAKWNCPLCNHTNDGHRKECSNCSFIKEGEEDEEGGTPD